MKTKQIFKYIVFALAAGIVLESCKDNVLTPVANNKPLDSLNQLIAALNKTLISVNKADAAINIKTAKYTSSKDSVNQARSNTTMTVQYTVYIIDGSTTAIPAGNWCYSCRTSNSGKGNVSKMATVNGATVVVSSGGNTYTATSADGRAIFNNIAVGGNATVTVTMTGYTSVTYTTVMFNSTYANQTSSNGLTSNVSTGIILLPTTGNNLVTYTGQMYINKSVLDDTLGNRYSASADTKNYLNFVSAPGTYTGANYSSIYWSQFTANIYSPVPTGTMIKWDQATNFGGVNTLFAYPSFMADFYQLGSITPGDPLDISITGLSTFATITNTGSYTVTAPAYANNPGTALAYGYTNTNSSPFQDSYTFGLTNTSDTVAFKATKIVTTLSDKKLHNTNWSNYNSTSKTYVVNYSQVWYSATRQYNFYPFTTNNQGNYTQLGNTSLFGDAGQTYTKNIYFFASGPTGN